MTYFRKIFFAALFAGLAGGLVCAVSTIVFTVPLILKAEVYEHEAEHAATDAPGEIHEHASPTENRNLLTIVAMIVAYVGFALILAAVSEYFDPFKSWQVGIAWGFAGFLVFSLVPALGLPPELPGMPAAPLEARQLWWVACAACTACSILVAVRYQRWQAYMMSGLVVLVPFLIGAPASDETSTLIPGYLHFQFIVITLIINLASWVVLGGSLAISRQISGKHDYNEQHFA